MPRARRAPPGYCCICSDSFEGERYVTPDLPATFYSSVCFRCLAQCYLCSVPDCLHQVHYGPIQHEHPDWFSCAICEQCKPCRTYYSPVGWPDEHTPNALLRQTGVMICRTCAPSCLSRCSECQQEYFVGNAALRIPSVPCRCLQLAAHTYRPDTFQYRRAVTVKQKGKRSPVVLSSEHSSAPDCFLGFELEIELHHPTGPNDPVDVVRAVKQSGLPFYCKRDGSLGATGVEIVSHPATLSAWRAMWPDVAKLYADLRDIGARSYDTTTCGLHVHVGRQAFTGRHHVYKLLRLLYNNPYFVFALSQRPTWTNFAKWASLDDLSPRLMPLKASVAFNGPNDRDWPRYSAVNLVNGYSAELRFFKGTLNSKSVLRALESADAFTRWTRDVSAQDASSLPLFTAFVKSEAKQYENFAPFVTTRLLEPTGDVGN